MGIFDFLKKVTESDNVQNTTTIRYASDCEKSGSATHTDGSRTASAIGALRITVQDVFTITGRGTVITGCVEVGQVSVGDTVRLRRVSGECRDVVVTGIEVFRKTLDTATQGMNVGVLLRGIAKDEIGRGDVLEK